MLRPPCSFVGTSRRVDPLARVGLLVVLVWGMALSVPRPAVAADQVPFASRFSVNANGNVLTIGNRTMTCGQAFANCLGMLNGTALGSAANNNDKNMVNLDADADASTKNSSMSRLNVPSGATVLFAGLYWGASTAQDGSGGTPANVGLIGRMSLRPPGLGGLPDGHGERGGERPVRAVQRVQGRAAAVSAVR